MDKNETESNLEAALPIEVVRAFPLDIGNQYVPDGPIPPGWTPEFYLYYRLGLELNNGILRFRYLPGSGLADIVAGGVSDFARQVVAGKATVRTPLSALHFAPHIWAARKCYVVIELDSTMNWRFSSDSAGLFLKTAAPAQYFALAHMDSENVAGNRAPPPPKICRVLYFGVSPLTTGDDAFALHVQFDLGFNKLLDIIIDPDIKNRGGQDENFMSFIA